MAGLGSVATGLSQAAATNAKAKRCILLFLLGGPPQHSTWDPKPNASEEIRGAYKAIPSSVPGTQICELLPQTARLMHRIALLRAVTTGDHAHSSSGYAMLTGQPHQQLTGMVLLQIARRQCLQVSEEILPNPPHDSLSGLC